MNSNGVDGCDDIRATAETETLESIIRSLREYLMEMNSSLFSVEELSKLILPYNRQYAQEYKEWLLWLKKKADKGIALGKCRSAW